MMSLTDEYIEQLDKDMTKWAKKHPELLTIRDKNDKINRITN